MVRGLDNDFVFADCSLCELVVDERFGLGKYCGETVGKDPPIPVGKLILFNRGGSALFVSSAERTVFFVRSFNVQRELGRAVTTLSVNQYGMTPQRVGAKLRHVLLS